MKPKHIQNYLRQCLLLADLSPCPRRKYGALAVDPEHNVIITAGYNGTARGSGDALCGGKFCRRDGVRPENMKVIDLGYNGRVVRTRDSDGDLLREPYNFNAAEQIGDEDLKKKACDLFPPIPSGSHYEIGCHHSESNVVANAARLGRSLAGAWLFCSGMPCEGCARIIHQAGIVKVVTLPQSYLMGAAKTLMNLGIQVVFTELEPDLESEVRKALENTDDASAVVEKVSAALGKFGRQPVKDPGRP